MTDALSLIGRRRWHSRARLQTTPFPPNPPRIGVFVCHCGGTISDVVEALS